MLCFWIRFRIRRSFCPAVRVHDPDPVKSILNPQNLLLDLTSIMPGYSK